MECTDSLDEFSKLHTVLCYNLQWFAQDGEGGEKTEPATEKKLKDAREEGKVAKSKELTAAFDLIVLFLVLKIFISFVGGNLIGLFSTVYKKMPDFLKESQEQISSVSVTHYLNNVILQFLLTVLPFFAFGVVITILVSIIQVGFKISTKPMAPKLSKFNPINGFKRILSKDSIFELLKSVLKVGIIMYVAYSSVKSHQNLSQKDIINFLFMPSFSMAKQITDISGRGVGLDVVKSGIEQLGGDVSVSTELGKGTTFTVRLPLTLAIIQALMVEIRDEIYAIALGSISNIEDIPVKDIKYVQAKEVIHLRGSVIPIIRLDKMLDIEPKEQEPDHLTVVIVQKGDQQAGLVVDNLIGQQEIVIKSLGKYINGNKLISGATILGDGDVALILDVNTLM